MQQVQVSFPDARGVGWRTAAASQQMMEPPMHIPVFLDRTFRMVEQGPADVVCWSRAGSSFIIKQVSLFEGLLPSYYNHKKYMSFVRQLNFYGFQKVKRKTRSRVSSSEGGGARGAAAATEEESESWAEFRHPQFRRGRRDLLAGITRQKDSGRLKRKQADARKSDIISALATDVVTVSGDLKAVKGKLDSIMSLLLNMASSGGQNRAAPRHRAPQSQDNTIRDRGVAAAAAVATAAAAAGEGGGGDGGGVRFVASAASTATARCGFGQWPVDEDSASGGGTRRSGHDPYGCGVLFDYRPTPCLSDDQQQEEWQGHPLYSQLPEERPSPAERYPVVPNQERYDPLPPLGAAVEARTSEISSGGPSRQQLLPPLHLSPPRAPPSNERKHDGGEGKGETSPKPTPRNRGDGSGGGGGGGGGGGTSPSCASADGDPHDAQRRRQQQQQQQQQWERRGLMNLPTPPRQNREVVDNGAGSRPGGGRRVAVANQTRQGSVGGAASTI